MVLEPPRGMDDLLPEEFSLKQKIVDIIREVYKKYGYLEVETPTVEYYELFEAKSGEEIRERMFDFYDKAGRRCVLRPEVTASIARLVSTRLKAVAPPLRLGYIADCYRYDEPQWGRRRRFWHGGFELFGSSSPLSDAEILQVSYEVFQKIGLEEQFFKIGHVGIFRNILESSKVNEKIQDKILTSIDRKRFDEAYKLMEEADVDVEVLKSIRELTESPPVVYRVGEVDRTSIKKIEDVLSPWSDAVRSFENLLEIVELAIISGVKSDVYIIPGMARGLEYYTGFIFEQGLPSADISFNGGGRYDRLVELFGGKPTPAVGCAIGISRILQYLIEKKNTKIILERPKVLLTPIPDVDRRYVANVIRVLRSSSISFEVDVLERRITSAIEYALKNGFRFLIIVGKSEEESREISVRDLERMVQVRYSLNEVDKVKKMIEEVG
ncbi:MAG: histidine--tRNA ligase [Aigarchaeota archaeon]|nr:histidine--tRNA ligase [Aigarchaeota archaeon]MCX8192461.1 histidine--tRNA ligase [Nitrososphaeria archaeon]MDW7986716.1 histidine--tRNA ligase [Nitrososphaerota archaeon]